MKYIVGLLLFSLVITAFLVIPDSGDDVTGRSGFWGAYDFTLGSNDLADLDATANMSIAIRNTLCQVNPQSNSCQEISRVALGASGSAESIPIQGMVQGAYGALMTVVENLGIAKIVIETSGLIIGIPPILTDNLISLAILMITITVILIVFGRDTSGGLV